MKKLGKFILSNAVLIVLCLLSICVFVQGRMIADCYHLIEQQNIVINQLNANQVTLTDTVNELVKRIH